MSVVFKQGDQVVYTPGHAKGDPAHPDAEFGFVMAPAGFGSYFCRYWRRGEPGVLRTVANSEGTPAYYLAPYWSVPQEVVEQTIDEIIAGQMPRERW